MSAELIGILGAGAALLGVGAALAGLIFASQARTGMRIDALGATVAALGERMARVEGLLEGAGWMHRADAPSTGD